MTTDAELFEALKYRVTVDRHGTRRYYNSSNLLHREAGPAVEYIDGTSLWYQDGVLHRMDGPATVRATGYSEWWIKGIPHSKQSYLAAGGKE